MQSEFSCENCRGALLEFIDNSINPLQKQLVDQHLAHCNDCNESLQQLWEMQSLSTRWNEESVPVWSRRSKFFEPYRWWPGLQLVSTFASLLAVVVVLGSAEISMENGFSLRFGPENYLTQADLEQRVAEIRTEQDNLLQFKVSNLTSQQAAANQLLLRTVLDMSRAERRQELNSVFIAWDQAQGQRTRQTNESLRLLLASQLEDRRNIEQLNRFFRHASYEGNDL